MRKKLLLREEGTSDLGGSSTDLGGSSSETSSCSCEVIVQKLEYLERRMIDLNAENCEPYCEGGSSCHELSAENCAPFCLGGSSCHEANEENCIPFCEDGCSVDIELLSSEFIDCLQNNGAVSCADLGNSTSVCICSLSQPCEGGVS